MSHRYICPVCGYPDLEEQPRGVTTGGSYEICPSCGFQFGVSDEDRGYTYERWSEEWIKKGQHWSSVGVAPPSEWNPNEQIKNISKG